MSAARCVHDMVSSWCAICTKRDDGEWAKRDLQRLLLAGPHHWLAARYASYCVCCGDAIAIGEPITQMKLPTGQVGWSCVCSYASSYGQGGSYVDALSTAQRVARIHG